MTQPTNNAQTSPPTSSSSSNIEYNQVMESLLRISLAGFGGALAGLSISRRGGGGVGVGFGGVGVGGLNSKAKLRKTTPYIDAELPTTWAVSCLTFAGIVEFCRVVSPAFFIMNVIVPQFNEMIITMDKRNSDNDEEGTNTSFSLSSSSSSSSPSNDDNWKKSIQTISDYTIGGSIAGALFKGASVQTRAGARLSRAGIGIGRASAAASSSSSSFGGTAASAAARTGILAGMIPGATLGCLAGVLMVGLDFLEVAAIEAFEDNGDDDDDDEMTRENKGNEKRVDDNNDEEEEKEGDIPSDIQKMTNEEIQKEIEEYRSLSMKKKKKMENGADEEEQ